MSKATAEQIRIIEEVADLVVGTVRRDYSGRGMFGAKCWGIECRSKDAAGECLRLTLKKLIEGWAYDDMGKGCIVYWPGIEGEAEQG